MQLVPVPGPGPWSHGHQCNFILKLMRWSSDPLCLYGGIYICSALLLIHYFYVFLYFITSPCFAYIIALALLYVNYTLCHIVFFLVLFDLASSKNTLLHPRVWMVHCFNGIKMGDGMFLWTITVHWFLFCYRFSIHGLILMAPLYFL